MRPRNTPLTTLYLPTPTFTGELALDPAVVWIEPLFPMRAANRYAKGTCQSGSYASQPLEAASINITGMGQVTPVVLLPPPPPPLQPLYHNQSNPYPRITSLPPCRTCRWLG